VASNQDNIAWEIKEEDRRPLRGAGRVSFLNSYVTQDIKGLARDGVALGAFLTQKGKLVSEVTLLNLEEKILLLFPPGYGAKVESHLATFLMFADATLDPPSQDEAHFAVAGPEAIPVLTSLGLPVSEGPANTLQRLSYAGTQVLAFPSLHFGAQAWELLVPSAAAEEFRAALAAEAARGTLGSPTREEIESRRIEAGIPKMGVDMGEDNLVAEVGLDERATSFNKGCYLGQETTARVQSRGHVNRKLTRLRLNANFAGPFPVDLLQGEKKVGALTSVAISPRLGGPIGLGTVQLSAWENNEPIYFSGPAGKIEVSKE